MTSDETIIAGSPGSPTPGPGSHFADDAPGSQVGPYRLLSPLGEGGFGSVWLAERREPFVQRVALKIVKAGMDSKAVVARFEQERQALAVMNHPGIARVLDGGLTSRGRPYFVMEYVRGKPITQFADERRLPLAARLELFLQVCEAVQHAHLKGIIHRDLKPTNILAFDVEGGDPGVKVIDFGIAKATQARQAAQTIFTETGQMIGTPEYMSPEQADPSGEDIDTRSDVYSLGVVLYELLSGLTPIDPRELRAKAYREQQRLIASGDVPAPSTRLSTVATKDSELASRIGDVRRQPLPALLRSLRRELEWIPLKAMRRERQERYQAATDLARDVRNYLEGKPLVAGPEGAWYRVRKFVRRNRAAVVTAGLVGASLMLGLGLATWQWREAVAAGQAAELARRGEQERADQLERVSDFQRAMLAQVDSARAGTELVEDLAQRLAASLEREGVPAGERDARVGAVRLELARLNATDAAAAMIDRAILRPGASVIDERFRDQPLVEAQLRQALASLYASMGMYEQALPLQDSALSIRLRELGADHPDSLRSRNNMGELLQDAGRIDDAEPHLRTALDGRRRVLGEDAPETLDSIGNLGTLLRAQGKAAEAEPYYREVLERSRRVLGPDHPGTLVSLSNMGILLRSQGKAAEAEACYREVLEKRRRLLGDDHPETITSIGNLGVALRASGRLEESGPLLRESLDRSRRALGEDHPATLVAISALGNQLMDEKRLGEAEPYYRDALDRARRVLGPGHPQTLRYSNNLAVLLKAQERPSDAEPFAREAYEGRLRGSGLGHEATRTYLGNLSMTLRAQRKFTEAEALLLSAFDRCRSANGDSGEATAECARLAAAMYAAWDEAEPGMGHGDKAKEWGARADAAKAGTTGPGGKP